jgi:hypothetical protein
MPQEAPVKEYVQPISKNIYDSCKENLEQIFFLPVYNSTITDLDDIKNEKLTFISYVIFAQDIANDNVKRDIIEMILEMPELKENDQLFSLAIKLVDTLPYNEDLHYQLGILGTSHKEMSKKLSHIITEKIEKRLSELFYSDKTSIIMIRHIVSIYQTLFEKIDAYSDKAFQVAHNCFKRKNSDYDLKYQAIFLLAAIVEKGLKNDKDYDKFINLACNEFKYGTVNLFKALFNKGKGFEEAREVITLNQTMEYMLCERLEELRNSYLIVKTIN